MSQGNSSVSDPPHPTAHVLPPACPSPHQAHLCLSCRWLESTGGQEKTQRGRKADQTRQLERLWTGGVGHEQISLPYADQPQH